MLTLLARNWGWVLLRGVAALIFGLLALFNPGITLVVLVILLIAAWAVITGIIEIVSNGWGQLAFHPSSKPSRPPSASRRSLTSLASAPFSASMSIVGAEM